MSKKIWVTKDKKKIHIKDMTTPHLINTMAMLERIAEIEYAAVCTSFPSFQGEMAQYYAEQQWEAAVDAGVEGELPDIYWDMQEELRRRQERGTG